MDFIIRTMKLSGPHNKYDGNKGIAPGLLQAPAGPKQACAANRALQVLLIRLNQYQKVNGLDK